MLDILQAAGWPIWFLLTASFVNAGATFLVTGLTAGSNTFTQQYKVNGGTGTFANRRLLVIPL